MKRYPFIFLLMICCGGAVATQLHAWSVNPAVTNYVFDLDGTNSCFRLPSHIFDGQKAITVEAWAKWQSFGLWSRVFDFGDRSNSILLANYGTKPSLEFEVWPNTNGLIKVRGTNALQTNQWVYVAAAAGSAKLDALVNWAQQARGSDVLEDDLSLMELEL